MPPAEQYY